MQRLHKSGLLVIPVCLAVLAGCGGGKSSAEKVKDGAAAAKAACDVFVHFNPPSGTDTKAQIEYAKASGRAFIKSAELASEAADNDPRWKALQSSAEREAAAFAVIAKAATGGATLDRAAVARAVATTREARPIFVAECAKADPKFFSSPSPSASASPTATGTGKGV